jgi:hypothetical protein
VASPRWPSLGQVNPGQPGADRADRDAERLRRLGVVQAGPYAQGEHVALAAPQARDGGADAPQPRGVVQAAGQVVGEVRDLLRLRQPAHGGLVPADRSVRVPGHVQGDAEQPGQQGAAFGPYGLAEPPGLEEGERDHLLGGRPAAGQPERVVVYGPGVLLEEHAELVMVSGAHPGALT